MNKREVKPFTVWRHFKGKTVVVITIAKHSETNEQLVIYKCLDNNGKGDMYARPLNMFLSEVDSKKYPDEKQKYRFEEIKND